MAMNILDETTLRRANGGEPRLYLISDSLGMIGGRILVADSDD